MRHNVATLILFGGLVLGAAGCGVADEAAVPGKAAGTVTVTDMKQLPDGTWSVSTRTIPTPQGPPPTGGDVEQMRSALTSLAGCSAYSSIVLFAGANYSGSTLCLEPTGVNVRFNLPRTYRSGYTMSPLLLYDVTDKLIFYSCNNSFKFTPNFAELPAISAQEASPLHGICHF